VAEKLLPDKAKELTRDLAMFTNEATSDKPRRKWWELSLEGIKKPCAAVGEIGKTVNGLAEKIGPFLILLDK
jgi:hypothetical protein